MDYLKPTIEPFREAVGAIREAYGYGGLPDNDRDKRISHAADCLSDFVYEFLVDQGLLGSLFKPKHLPIIERMIAIGMMVQFEHDHQDGIQNGLPRPDDPTDRVAEARRVALTEILRIALAASDAHTSSGGTKP